MTTYRRPNPDPNQVQPTDPQTYQPRNNQEKSLWSRPGTYVATALIAGALALALLYDGCNGSKPTAKDPITTTAPKQKPHSKPKSRDAPLEKRLTVDVSGDHSVGFIGDGNEVYNNGTFDGNNMPHRRSQVIETDTDYIINP